MLATGSYTLNDLLDAYSSEYLQFKAPGTRYQQLKHFGRFRQEMGTLLLTDLTPALLRVWRDTLSACYAPGTVRRYMDSLSGPLTIAVRDYEWLAENPLRKVKKPPETPARVRFLSTAERAALLAQCAVSRNPHLYTFVLLALSTGARKEQLRQLRWREVDVERGLVRLQASKQTPRRTMPLLGPVREVLRRRSAGQAPESWVFPRHDALQPILFNPSFRTACRRAGITNFKIHDLRHTCASYLAMNGASLRDIMEVLGHKTLAMAAKYTHLTADHTAGVLGRMIESFLAGVLLASTLTTLVSVWLTAA